MAIGSARGPAARGVVRLSGPLSLLVVAPRWRPLSAAHELNSNRSQVVQGTITIPSLGQVPAQLCTWPNQRSYTRQPTVEIHTIGSPIVLDAIIEELCQAGCRLARPGEFTLRAFLAGRLDLTQAEAVLGVIDAKDAVHLQQSLRQLAGGLSHPLQEIRALLLDLCADLEAGLDFVDEDISFLTIDELKSRIEQAEHVVSSVLDNIKDRSVHTEIPIVAIWGVPNAGKSNLLNALSRSSISIVSPQAGTTRDYVSHRVDWHGSVFELVDTAGIEDVPHSATPESLAQNSTQELLDRAALRLLCVDTSRALTVWERNQLALSASMPDLIVVETKCDIEPQRVHDPHAMRTSSHLGAGLSQLLGTIAERLAEASGSDARSASTYTRCTNALQSALESLQLARWLAEHDGGEELVASEIRTSLAHLSDVVGAVYTNDLLDRVFSRFCIGK